MPTSTATTSPTNSKSSIKKEIRTLLKALLVLYLAILLISIFVLRFGFVSTVVRTLFRIHETTLVSMEDIPYLSNFFVGHIIGIVLFFHEMTALSFREKFTRSHRNFQTNLEFF